MKFQNFRVITTSRNAWRAVAILIAGLILTTAGTVYTERYVEAQSKKEFSFVCNEIKEIIDKRLHSHALLLRSGASLFAASDTVTRIDWKAFIEHSELKKNLPGIQGVGFSFIIQKDQLQRHIQNIRKEGFPEYTVNPSGQRDLYTSIIFLEPFADRNLKAFGYDMYSEPVRRAAMEQARDYNMATLSGKVILVQETDKDLQAGVLMYVPVYRNGLPANSMEERRAAILGWVYSPFRMYDLMLGTLGRWNSTDQSRIHLMIYDNNQVSPVSLLFDSQRNDSINRNDLSTRMLTIPIEFNGKRWTLLFSQPKERFPFY